MCRVTESLHFIFVFIHNENWIFENERKYNYFKYSCREIQLINYVYYFLNM